jgi:hypothetical protein
MSVETETNEVCGIRKKVGKGNITVLGFAFGYTSDEHLHLLEEQMKRSIKLFERLKSASNTPKPNQHSFEHDNVEIINKLRTINSMPSNLRELGWF